MVFTSKKLQKEMEFLRKDMIQKGISYGLNSELTILASQKLDALIYQYQFLNNSQITAILPKS